MDNYHHRSVLSGSALWIFLTITTLAVASCNSPGPPTIERVELIAPSPSPTAVGTVTRTPAPFKPTRTPTVVGTISASQGEATATPPEAKTPGTVEPQPPVLVTSELARFGITIARTYSDVEAAHALGLPFGATLNWNVMRAPPEVPAEFWQLVRVNQEGIRRTSWNRIEEVLAAYPGSFWIVGNEPDVQWQDNVTPQRYAEIYHEVYGFVKERDPAARVVIGGVAQPTPLRRAYLDIVLDSYESTFGEPMPVDVWNVHAFILREEEDSWGVGIPPGMAGAEGTLYEIEDHDDIEVIARNIRDFRKWMRDRGYGDRPLVISEYGILMPEDYGFPPERTAAFLESSFDLFRELAGEDGYAQDENRLVQWWFWYSLYDDLLYKTGNLWDEETNQLTELGQIWTSYITENDISGGNE